MKINMMNPFWKFVFRLLPKLLLLSSHHLMLLLGMWLSSSLAVVDMTEAAWIIIPQQQPKLQKLSSRTSHHHGRCSFSSSTSSSSSLTTTTTTIRRTPFSTRTKNIQLQATASSSSSVITTQQITIFDGAEWISLQECCWKPAPPTTSRKAFSNKKFGYMNVVMGTISSKEQPSEQQKQRVIGIQVRDDDDIQNNKNNNNNADDVVWLSNQVAIYRDSMAWIPSSSNKSNIPDADIISTYIAAMSLHCCLPKLDNVGGSGSSSSSDNNDVVLSNQSVNVNERENENTAATSIHPSARPTTSSSSTFIIPGSKVVVLGGSDMACFAAEGLATLGAMVYLVTTGSPKVRHANVQVLKPAVGEMQLGFCSVVGQFDAMLDTLHDERKRPVMEAFYRREDEEDNDNELLNDDDDLAYATITASVLPLLEQRHSCTRYYSTLTQAQQMVREGGVLFGPRQAEDHMKHIAQQLLEEEEASRTNRKRGAMSQFQYVGPPPLGLGHTVQTLLEHNVLLPKSAKYLVPTKATTSTTSKTPIGVRGWSLSDFWEYTTWPRDTTGDVRYGLPVLTESEFSLLRTATQAKQSLRDPRSSSRPSPVGREGDVDDVDDEQDADESSEASNRSTASNNPFVTYIANIEDLQRDIVAAQRDCVLFLSAAFCRTCRSIQPAYGRLARTTSTQSDDGDSNDPLLVFAQADTSGTAGKELGRALAVASVPTFVLFKRGRRYGPPMSISKLPSKKLNLAISLLSRGLPWDNAAFAQLEQEGGTTKK